MENSDTFYLQLFLPYLLNQAAEESSLSFQRVYKDRYGMLRTEWRVLFHLGIFGQMTARDIGLRARLHKTKISRAVQKLADRRFITRHRSDADRRQELLELTAAGRTAYLNLRTIAERYQADLGTDFTKAELALLQNMLQRLAGKTGKTGNKQR